VILDRPSTPEERALLLAHDTDPFCRWEAGRALARDVLIAMIRNGAAPGPHYLRALETTLADDRLDPAFRALVLRLPSDEELAQTLHEAGATPDPDAIHAARNRLRDAVAAALEAPLAEAFARMKPAGPFSPDPRMAGQRALRLAALGYLSRSDRGTRAARLFAEADNMTEQLGALACLVEAGAAGAALADFARRWAGDRLVMDKWFAVQIAGAAPDHAVALARELTARPDFDWRNPNRFRAVIGALAGNHAGFHRADGAGYGFVADWLIRLDPVNPQTAARMSTAFETWARYDAGRQAQARAALQRMLDTPGLSRDVTEMAARMLG
jgi:aminopeptidase N